MANSEYWSVNVNAETEQALKKLLDRNKDGSDEYKVVAQLLGDIHYSAITPRAPGTIERCPVCSGTDRSKPGLLRYGLMDITCGAGWHTDVEAR